MVACNIENAGAPGSVQSATRTGLERTDYRNVIRGGEVVKCSVLKGIELTAGEVLRGKAVSENVMQYDAGKQPPIVRLQRTLQYYLGLWHRGNKKGRAASTDRSGRGHISREPDGKCKKKA